MPAMAEILWNRQEETYNCAAAAAAVKVPFANTLGGPEKGRFDVDDERAQPSRRIRRACVPGA